MCLFKLDRILAHCIIGHFTIIISGICTDGRVPPGPIGRAEALPKNSVLAVVGDGGNTGREGKGEGREKKEGRGEREQKGKLCTHRSFQKPCVQM